MTACPSCFTTRDACHRRTPSHRVDPGALPASGSLQETGVMLNIIRRLIGPAPARKGITSAELAEMLRCGGIESTSGQMVTTTRAMRVATVYACVRILAESIAQLPCKVYKCGPDGSHDVLTEGPLFNLMHFPNTWQNGFEFREYLMTCLCLRGNFYALKVKVRGDVVELLPLRPEAVSVERRNWELLYTYTDANGRTGTVGSDKMLHVRGLSLDGIMGVSPIRYGRDAIGLAMATERHGARMFKNGARPGGVLKHPAKLSDEALEHLKLSWEAAHGGENTGGTAILEEGMSYDNISMTNEDAQYLDTRQFQRTEICALFRVPPHMIGDLTKSSFSNIEQQALEFVKYSVLPWCKRIETAFWHGLLSEEQRRQGYRVEFLVDGLERADIKTRYESYSIAIQNGIMSPNECRRLENRNPREGGDVYLQPLNMTDSGGAGGDTSGDVKTVSIESIFPPRGFSTVLTFADEESRKNFDKLFDMPQPAESVLAKDGFHDRELAAKAASDEDEEDDEHDHDDWADGEWSEESADLNQIMRDFRPKLEKMYRKIVAKEVAEIRKLVDKYFPETEEKRRTKSAAAEFEEALRLFYSRLKPELSSVCRPLYADLAGVVVAMAAKQTGVDVQKLLKDVQSTVKDYAAIEAENYVASSVGQLRKLVAEGDDPYALLQRRIAEWEANRHVKLAKRDAVYGPNWYAREAYKKAGVTKVRWVANGSKTCSFCSRLHGVVAGIDDNFVNRGERMPGRSGKSGGHTFKRGKKQPPIHRGCVCAQVPVLVPDERLYPDELAGVKRGEPMSFKEADEGRSNPRYDGDKKGYCDNCTACVIAFEARLRGYDVEARSATGNKVMRKLSNDQRQAWADPSGKPLEMENAGNSAEETLSYLKKRMVKGERYVFKFDGPGYTHIIHAFLDDNGVNLFDPQAGALFTGDNDFHWFSDVLAIDYTKSPRIMRVDNLLFNKDIVDHVLKKKVKK